MTRLLYSIDNRPPTYKLVQFEPREGTVYCTLPPYWSEFYIFRKGKFQHTNETFLQTMPGYVEGDVALVPPSDIERYGIATMS